MSHIRIPTFHPRSVGITAKHLNAEGGSSWHLSLCEMSASLGLPSGRRDKLAVWSEVSSRISNMAACVARRAGLMTVTATGSILVIPYLHPLKGVKFPCRRRACATCMYSPNVVDRQGLDDCPSALCCCLSDNSWHLCTVPDYCVLIWWKKCVL